MQDGKSEKEVYIMIPKVRQKLLYDAPKKVFEFCRDVLPFICLAAAVAEPVLGAILLSDVAVLAICAWVVAKFAYTLVNHFWSSPTNLTIHSADTGLRIARTLVGSAFEHLPASVRGFLERPLPVIGVALKHTAVAIGLGAMHLAGYAYLTWMRRKALQDKFGNNASHVFADGIRRTRFSKMLSVNLKLAFLGMALTGVGMLCAAPFVAISGFTIAGTFAAATALDIALWAARLVYKYRNYTLEGLPPGAAGTAAPRDDQGGNAPKDQPRDAKAGQQQPSDTADVDQKDNKLKVA